MALGAPLSNINDGSRSLVCFPESLNDSCGQPNSVPAYTKPELIGDAETINDEGGRNHRDNGIVESSGMAMMTCQKQGEECIWRA